MCIHRKYVFVSVPFTVIVAPGFMAILPLPLFYSPSFSLALSLFWNPSFIFPDSKCLSSQTFMHVCFFCRDGLVCGFVSLWCAWTISLKYFLAFILLFGGAAEQTKRKKCHNDDNNDNGREKNEKNDLMRKSIWIEQDK